MLGTALCFARIHKRTASPSQGRERQTATIEEPCRLFRLFVLPITRRRALHTGASAECCTTASRKYCVVVILRELLHIKGQKLLIHHKRTVLIFYKCAGAVCSAPVTLSGVGTSRLNKYDTEQQNRKNHCNYFPFHLFHPPLFSANRYLYITSRYL